MIYIINWPETIYCLRLQKKKEKKDNKYKQASVNTPMSYYFASSHCAA